MKPSTSVIRKAIAKRKRSARSEEKEATVRAAPQVRMDEGSSVRDQQMDALPLRITEGQSPLPSLGSPRYEVVEEAVEIVAAEKEALQVLEAGIGVSVNPIVVGSGSVEEMEEAAEDPAVDGAIQGIIEKELDRAAETEAQKTVVMPSFELLEEGQQVAARDEVQEEVLDSLLHLKGPADVPSSSAAPAPTSLPQVDSSNIPASSEPTSEPAREETDQEEMVRVDSAPESSPTLVQSVTELTRLVTDMNQRLRNMEDALLTRADLMTITNNSASGPVEHALFRMGVRFHQDLLLRRGVITPEMLQNDELIRVMLKWLDP